MTRSLRSSGRRPSLRDSAIVARRFAVVKRTDFADFAPLGTERLRRIARRNFPHSRERITSNSRSTVPRG